MEFQLHYLPDFSLSLFRFRVENLSAIKIRCEICQKKYGIGSGFLDYWSVVLFGWVG